MDAFQESLTVTARDGAVAAGRDVHLYLIDLRESRNARVRIPGKTVAQHFTGAHALSALASFWTVVPSHEAWNRTLGVAE